MPINSKNKGKVGEREAAEFLGALTGLPWRRTQQFRGHSSAADIELCDQPTPVHVEVKRDEHLNVILAVQQAVTDSAGKAVPLVLHRKNATPWLITFRADDLSKFIEAFTQILTTGKNNAKKEDQTIDANKLYSCDAYNLGI